LQQPILVLISYVFSHSFTESAATSANSTTQKILIPFLKVVVYTCRSLYLVVLGPAVCAPQTCYKITIFSSKNCCSFYLTTILETLRRWNCSHSKGLRAPTISLQFI
jgi:hypothetical protein